MPLQSSFIRNVSKIFSGLFIVQIINILFALLLPRIYVPEDFALFGIFLSTTFILFEVINLRLDQALMIPQDEEESIFIYNKSILYAIGISLIALLVLGVFFFTQLISNDYLKLLWIPLSLLLQGIIQPTMTFLNRTQQYSMMNIMRILQVILTGVVSCIPLLFETEKIFLIEGFIAGQLSAILLAVPTISKNLSSSSEKNQYSLQPYWNFPKYGTISSLCNNLSRNSIVYVLSVVFTPQIVGLYTFTNRLVQAPLGMITSSVGQIFFREASQSTSSEQVKYLTSKVEKSLSLMAILPVMITLGFGPTIFVFLFGEEWRVAGEIAKYLSIWYGTSLVVTPLSMLIDVKGRLKWEMYYNIIFAICRIGLLIIGGLWGNFTGTMLLFCAVSVFFNIYLWIFVKQIIVDDNRTTSSISR